MICYVPVGVGRIDKNFVSFPLSNTVMNSRTLSDLQEADISKKRPTFIKAKERVTHTQKKLESALKTLEQARKANEAHQADIRKLEEELRQVEEQKAAWELAAGTSHAGRADVHLEEAQIRQYEELKMEASRQAARYLQELDSVNREQKADQDRLESELRRKGEFDGRHRQKGHERAEAAKRVEKLSEHIRGSEAALDEQRRLRDELQRDVGECRGRAQQLQAQLEDVAAQLGDARVDKHEEARRRKKQEIVESFKREIPGVYDRMINMCQPTHKRYNVAITKVLGKYMEAIVVDTEKTARRCIQVLKERMLEPETFLPLDYIQAKPLRERLRFALLRRSVALLAHFSRFLRPQGHQGAEEREAAVRRAALRAGGHPPRGAVRDQQRAGLRDARGRVARGLRPRPQQEQPLRRQCSPLCRLREARTET